MPHDDQNQHEPTREDVHISIQARINRQQRAIRFHAEIDNASDDTISLFTELLATLQTYNQ